MSDIEFPDWFTAAKVSEKTLQVKGKTYTVHILSRELAPALVGFVGQERATGEFFASEDLPDEFFPYTMLHEILEFTQFQGLPGRCRCAMILELDRALVLSDDRFKVYLQYRRDFFRSLVEYYRNKDGMNELRSEIAGGLDYLEWHIAKMG